MLIEYDGTDFCGWQYQPDRRTVQGEIESMLRKITSEDIKLTGAGRTDQGVHAFGQVANFSTTSPLKADEIQKAVNSMIDRHVHIKKIDEVAADFHSRFSARSKVYDYRIIIEPTPFELRYSWYVKYPLDLAAVNSVLESIRGEYDFAGFSVHNGKENTVCKIMDTNMAQTGEKITMKIEANRFLHKMVRGIVGFAVDVGRGRFSPRDTAHVFKDAIKDLYFAPPQGLFLVEVKY